MYGMFSHVRRLPRRIMRRFAVGRPFGNAAAFAAREKYRANYETLCQGLSRTLDFEKVLDVGSANGFIIDGMLRIGKEVRGVELSPSVASVLSEQARSRTTFGDATRLGMIGPFDLVTCIEVAEHVPPERSMDLVRALVVNSARWIYFTAATPYQGGVGHINCRPHFFWLRAFRQYGFHLDYDRTGALVDEIGTMQPASWIPLNSLILGRAC